MTKLEAAKELFGGGLNCAQAVFAAFCEDYGLDRATGFKLAGGLGGGARCGELCGAVSGALLVVGMKYGQTDGGDREAKLLCNDHAARFTRLFRERCGSVVCRELLGCDTSTPEGRAIFERDNLHETVCASKAIATAVELLCELGY